MGAVDERQALPVVFPRVTSAHTHKTTTAMGASNWFGLTVLRLPESATVLTLHLPAG
jgi:hypothetical protein